MKALVPIIFLALAFHAHAQTVTTVSGQTAAGSANGSLTSATFKGPNGLCLDASGNIYVADIENHQIRKIDMTANMVSTLAGSTTSGSSNGNGAAAKFNRPTQLSADSVDNIYVADFLNSQIRKIDVLGNVTTFAGSGASGSADGPSASASFMHPTGIFMRRGTAYVADFDNNKLRKVVNGAVGTISGAAGAGYLDGPAASAKFSAAYSIVADKAGNMIVADRGNNKIRKIDLAGNVTTIAGSTQGYQDGPAATAKFNQPSFICLDSTGNIYVSDSYNHRIRKIDAAGNVTTIAGAGSGYADGIGTAAQFNLPSAIVFNKTENILYVADYYNNRIRQILLHPVTNPGNPGVGIEEHAVLNSFSVYPNPATTTLFLSSSAKAERTLITDVLGAVVYEHHGANPESIDITHLSEGVYFVQILAGSASRTIKFVKVTQ